MGVEQIDRGDSKGISPGTAKANDPGIGFGTAAATQGQPAVPTPREQATMSEGAFLEAMGRWGGGMYDFD